MLSSAQGYRDKEKGSAAVERLWIAILSYESQTRQTPLTVVPQKLPKTIKRQPAIVPDSSFSPIKGTK